MNLGVLLFAPETGERRLKLIEEQDELNRVRRLQADESLLLRLRDDLEDRFQSTNGNGPNAGDWQALLAKWDTTLSNVLQLSPQKGTLAQDLEAELERLYGDHVALQRAPTSAPRAAEPRCVLIASKCSDRQGYGTAFRKEYPLRSSREPVPLDHFAVWVAKLKPMIQ